MVAGLRADIAQLLEENEDLQTRLMKLELREGERDREEEERDQTLASTLRVMRSEIKELRRGSGQGGRGSAAGMPTPGTSGYTRLLRDISRGIGLDAYVAYSELKAFDYVSQATLVGQSYATWEELTCAIPPPPSLPLRLEPRLIDLETEVLQPTGGLRVLEDRVKALEDRRVGSAISVQGYVFRDAASVKAWSALSSDSEKFRMMRDAWVQLTQAVSVSSCTGEVLANKAAAMKAGYKHFSAAQVAATFEVMFPESVIRRSHTKADAAQGGWVWAAPFSTFTVFRGNVEQSTLSSFKSNLIANATQHQAAIDLAFPPAQSAHVKDHAIYSDILRRGCRQATELLECLIPFVDVLTAAGVTQTAAWLKALLLIKTVFTRVQRVRMVSSEPAGFAMEWGMMKATELLDEFSKLEIVRHPDVSYAMALSALQKGGQTIE